ncbi:MAG: hypothetical protein JWN60_809 [Acidobacteria bacterium]|jgi:hypothetical protein|nr:hypothetical protein [Acidobacteriota bacterium]
MTEEIKDQETEVNHTKENLESVGQMLIGGIETIGGILTANPVAHAEGEYNVEAGLLHQESNRVLTAIDENEEAEKSDTGNLNQP